MVPPFCLGVTEFCLPIGVDGMKQAGILIVLLGVFASSVFAASSASNSSSDVDGKVAPDAPCTAVFDKTRMWVPEKIVWKNKKWKCAKYDKDDIYCQKVIEIKEESPSSDVDEKVDPDTPTTGIFDRTRMWVPEKIAWKNKKWKCDKYDEDGIYCLKVIEVKKDSSSSENGENGKHATHR
jgi:hypothetical protein